MHDVIQVEQKSCACCKKWFTSILLRYINLVVYNTKQFIKNIFFCIQKIWQITILVGFEVGLATLKISSQKKLTTSFHPSSKTWRKKAYSTDYQLTNTEGKHQQTLQKKSRKKAVFNPKLLQKIKLNCSLKRAFFCMFF